MSTNYLILIMILGVPNIILAGWFWTKEYKYFRDHCHTTGLFQGTRNFFLFFKYGRPLMGDIIITWAAGGIFTFGMSGIGGVFGLMLSNVISFIIIQNLKEKRGPKISFVSTQQ